MRCFLLIIKLDMLQNIHKLLLNRSFVHKSWSILAGVGLVLVVTLLAMMNFFNPSDVGPNGLLIFFGLLYGICLVAVTALLKVYRMLFRKRIHSIKLLYLSSVAAFAPVMLLALNTLNQLGFLDVTLVLLFEALALFYIMRRME